MPKTADIKTHDAVTLRKGVELIIIYVAVRNAFMKQDKRMFYAHHFVIELSAVHLGKTTRRLY